METYKKVGIMTFHAADNYGAVLQSFALQRFLSMMGITNEIIDFSPESIISANEPLYIPEKFSLKKLLKQFAILPNYFKLRRRSMRFKSFRVNNLALSQRLRLPEEIQHIKDAYQVVITGSDQVFNPLTKYSNTYYLKDFNNVVKIAYAPSFGISKFTLIGEEKRALLRLFYRLSCREADGAAFLSEICGRDVPTVLDPVFLLERESWSKLARCPANGKYIFVYNLNGGENLIEIARRIKKVTGLPIICVSTRKYVSFNRGIDELHIDTAPEEFLGYVKDSEFVVTDSFHGSAFSLLFRRKVLAYVALKNASSRIFSLFNQLDIRGQIIDDIEEFKFERIVFKDFNCRLAELVKCSQRFLQEISNNI